MNLYILVCSTEKRPGRASFLLQEIVFILHFFAGYAGHGDDDIVIPSLFSNPHVQASTGERRQSNNPRPQPNNPRPQPNNLRPHPTFDGGAAAASGAPSPTPADARASALAEGTPGSPAGRSAPGTGPQSHRQDARKARPLHRRRRGSIDHRSTRHRKQTRDGPPTQAGGGAAPRARGRQGATASGSETGAPGRGKESNHKSRGTRRGSSHGRPGRRESSSHHTTRATPGAARGKPGSGSQRHRDANPRAKRESREAASRESRDNRTEAGADKTGRAAHTPDSQQRHRRRRGAHKGRALQPLGDGGGQTPAAGGRPFAPLHSSYP